MKFSLKEKRRFELPNCIKVKLIEWKSVTK